MCCQNNEQLSCIQVREVEADLRHKLFPPNAWMKVADFNILTSCPKDELHQWFIGLTVSTSFPVRRAHHVGRLEDLLGRVPLYPCYLDGNTTSTIPYKYAGRQKQALNSGVQTAKALHHAGAAMYMRSTTGCGTLADPSLELEDFLCPKLKGSAEGAGPRHPGALGRPGRPTLWLQMRYDKYMPGICLAYTCQIFMLSKNAF